MMGRGDIIEEEPIHKILNLLLFYGMHDNDSLFFQYGYENPN
jgi:hypothetical protein